MKLEDHIFIVVPVYKVEAYLDRCIGSILNQTYKNWELILVDDGSPDNCPAICDRYAAEHENTTVIHQENGGLSAARNAGIDYAMKHGDPEADWITFIDSDDFVHPKYLEYLHQAATGNHVGLSSCGYIRTAASGTAHTSMETVKYEYLSPEMYWCRDCINATVPWGKLYKLSLFEEIRFPVGRLHEDEFTTYRLLFRHAVIGTVMDPLYYYYTNPQSITHSSWNPRRLDAFDAKFAQLSFFDEHQYPDAYKLTLEILIKLCIGHRNGIRTASPTYDSLIPTISRYQRDAYSIYVQKYGLLAFLRFWVLIRIKKPIERIIHQESIQSFLKRKMKRFFR